MPTNIVIVHNDPVFLDKLEAALRATGDEIRGYASVLPALVELDEQHPVDLLITQMRFAPGASNGVALALMARRHNRGVRVLFIDEPGLKNNAIDLGTLLATPVSIPEVLDAIDRLRRT